MNDVTKVPSVPRNYEDLLDQDTHVVPEFFRKTGEQICGPDEVPVAWALDRDIYELEIERIWKKTWQMACRVEDVALVGDTFVYDIATLSFVIVRSSETDIKAYYNACLHRGRTLRDCSGNVSQLKCPYHGFAWSLDGELRGYPARNEFPTVNKDSFRLPQVKVATWGGFVFINPDPDAEPLEDYIGTLPREFERMPTDKRVKTVHVSKVLNCNWKIARDAFLEAYHVNETHPQLVFTHGDQYHRLEVVGNYSRGAIASFAPSPHLRGKITTRDLLDSGTGGWEDLPPMVEFEEGADVRAGVAEIFRGMARAEMGDFVDDLSDAEAVDIRWMSLFPNFNPYPHMLNNYVYRFRPNGNDHLSAIFDIMILFPDVGEEPLQVGKERRLGQDELFTDAPELAFVAPVLNQDISNLDQITKGLRNNQRGVMVLAGHEELQLRHFYKKYAEVMGFDQVA